MEPTNIKDLQNIQFSIYFKSTRIYDEEELYNIELFNDIQDELVSKFRVIKNDANVLQFTGIINKLNTYINNKDMCIGLDPIHILRKMLNSHAIITINSTTSDQIYGFAVIKFKPLLIKPPKKPSKKPSIEPSIEPLIEPLIEPPKARKVYEPSYLYLEILCSNKNVNVNGAGSILIEKLEEICKAISFNIIKLHSVKLAIPFYINHNFVKDEIGCTQISEDKSDCLMVKDLRNPRTDEDVDMVEPGGRINKTKRKHKSKRRKHKLKGRRTNKRTKSKRKTKRMK